MCKKYLSISLFWKTTDWGFHHEKLHVIISPKQVRTDSPCRSDWQYAPFWLTVRTARTGFNPQLVIRIIAGLRIFRVRWILIHPTGILRKKISASKDLDTPIQIIFTCWFIYLQSALPDCVSVLRHQNSWFALHDAPHPWSVLRFHEHALYLFSGYYRFQGCLVQTPCGVCA